MRIRFLHTVPSSRPDYPFQPGQVITAPKLTAEIRQWLRDGLAELVRETESSTEAAALAPPVRRGSR